MSPLRRIVLAFVAAAAPIAAQAQKKPLTQSDWDRWRSINGPTLSNDGKWVAYTLSPQVGDGEFVVRATSGTTEYRVPVGYIGRANNTPGGLRAAGGGGPPAGGGGRGGRGGGGGGGGGANGPFTADSRFAFVTTQPNKDEVERQQRAAGAQRGGAGRAGAGAAGAAAQNTIVMISLADGKITPRPDMRSYRLPLYSGKWMVFSPAPDSGGAADSTAAAGRAGAAAPGGRGGRGGRGGGGGGGGPGNRRTYGSTIVLRNLDRAVDERLTDVLAYEFDDSAKVLAYTVASHDSTKDGVYIRNLTTGATQTVLSGPGNYRAFTFDRAQQQFVFTSDRDEFGRATARHTVYYGTLKTGSAQAVVPPGALPRGMRLPDNPQVGFTRAGNAITLAIAPPPEDTVPADSLVGKANFDLWHWQDPVLQPTQKLQVGRDRNPTYQALYNLATKKFTQLTTDSLPQVQLSDDAKIALITTSVPYNVERMWGDGGSDVYLFDPATGARKEIAEKIRGNAQLSVSAKYVSYFNDGHWFTYNIATGKTNDITGPLKSVHFEQETWSTPNDPAAWGLAGWTKDDRSVLVNDRFDIWEIDPNGVRPAVVLTDSLGRRDSITFRMINLDRDAEDRYVDTTKPTWLSAFNENNKQSGFYRGRLDARHAPEKVVMADVRYGPPTKAKNADVYLTTKSTFADFPNLWVGPSLTALTKVSDANPWQKDYNWGSAELVTWLSGDGVPRQGILFKPEDFDPKKKYPMISYFYEDLSDGLHGYSAPRPGSSISVTHYVSNGYLVFEPDIYYEMGHPGQSALKSIVPGVQMLLARGYVDPKRLGLQGHSWGGYQTAYLITQTNMFAAAEAGAPVANMTSAYGGIRWGSGVNRSMQYENGQSRIGKSIWEGQNLYIENSPLFWLDRVHTPLLILHDDMDDAVPWYQGIELYVGMRRNGKEAYLINYNNELHSPQSRANLKDFAGRMQQFFDTKLKGAPAPDWMVHGIPAKDKGKDQLPKPVITP